MTAATMAHNLHLTAVSGAFPAPHNSSSQAPLIPNLDTHDYHDLRQLPASNASALEMAAMRRMFQRRQQTTGSTTETVDVPFDGSSVTVQRANSVASSTSSRGRRSGSSRESDPRSGTKVPSKSSKPLFSSGAFTSMGYAYASGAGPIIQAPLAKRQLPKTPRSDLASATATANLTQKTQPFVTRILARPPPPLTDQQQVAGSLDDKIQNPAVSRGGAPQHTAHPALHVAIADSSQQRSIGAPIPTQIPSRSAHPSKLVDPYSPETPLSALSSTSGSVPTSVTRTPDTPLSFGSSTYTTPVSSPTIYQPLSSTGIRSQTLPARNSSLARHTSVEIANIIAMQNGMPASPPPPRRPRSTSPAPPLPSSSRSPNDNVPPTSFNTFTTSLSPTSPPHIGIGKRMSQDEYLPRPSAPFAASSRSQSAPSSPIIDKPLPPVHSSSVDDSRRVATALAALGPERSPVKLEDLKRKSPLAGHETRAALQRFADVVQPLSAAPVQTRAPPSLAIIPPSPGVNQSFAISSSPENRHSSYSSTESPSTIRALDTTLYERTSADSGRSTPPLSEGSSASSITSDESVSSLTGLTGGSLGSLVVSSSMDNPSASSSRVTSPTTLRMRRRGYNFAEGLLPGSNGTSPAGSPGASPIPSPAHTRPASMALGEAWPFASLKEPNANNNIRQPGPGPHPIYSQHSATRSADFTPRPAEDDEDELKSEFHFYRHSGDKDRDPEVLNLTRPTSSLALNSGDDDDGDEVVISFAPSWPLPNRNNDVWPEQSSIVLMRYNDMKKKGKVDDVDLWHEADVIEVMAALRELRPAPLKGRK